MSKTAKALVATILVSSLAIGPALFVLGVALGIDAVEWAGAVATLPATAAAAVVIAAAVVGFGGSALIALTAIAVTWLRRCMRRSGSAAPRGGRARAP